MLLGPNELGKWMGNADNEGVDEAQLQEAAKQIHVLFQSLVDAGFTDYQAMELISMMVKSQ